MDRNNETIRLAKKAADAWRTTDTYHQAAQIIDMLISALEGDPTLTPRNEPLTMDELREMDGEPAWWDDGEGSCWGIISVDSAGMWGGIPFFRGRWRQVNFEYNIEERKMRIYRRQRAVPAVP